MNFLLIPQISPLDRGLPGGRKRLIDKSKTNDCLEIIKLLLDGGILNEAKCRTNRVRATGRASEPRSGLGIEQPRCSLLLCLGFGDRWR